MSQYHELFILPEATQCCHLLLDHPSTLSHTDPHACIHAQGNIRLTLGVITTTLALQMHCCSPILYVTLILNLWRFFQNGWCHTVDKPWSSGRNSKFTVDSHHTPVNSPTDCTPCTHRHSVFQDSDYYLTEL